MLSLRSLAACIALTAALAHAEELRYAGTVGRQHVTLRLDLQDDQVRGGTYTYDGQTSDIRIVDSRVYGTTAVLQDEDGNILHLHFQAADGTGAPGWAAAASLEGTLERGDLDLPVKLGRRVSSPAQPGPAR